MPGMRCTRILMKIGNNLPLNYSTLDTGKNYFQEESRLPSKIRRRRRTFDNKRKQNKTNCVVTSFGYYSDKMKRKSNLIEVCSDNDETSNSFDKKLKASFAKSYIQSAIMYKNTEWYRSLMTAEKSCMKEDKIKKIHYKFDDDREMVEEYNVDTQVLLRRAWKVKGKLGGEGKWLVEIGDPIPDATPSIETAEIVESKDQPIVTRRNTRVNLEWRVRNLPYPIEIYSISANNDDKCITVRTTNKKYFKKLQVPELERLKLPLEQANISSSHQFQTLIIMYKKPTQLLDMEKEWFEELKNVKPIKDIPSDCKTQ